MHADHFSIMRGGPLIGVIQAAKSACHSFAEYQGNFFDSDRPHAWRGWENWLAVDIGRRLNTKMARPFQPFPGKDDRRRMDLLVRDRKVTVAVEIKVNFLDDQEIATWGSADGLPDRVLLYRDKLATLPPSTRKLLIVSTCFESRASRGKYPRLVKRALRRDFRLWRQEWLDCSSARDGGWNLLLALHR